ncbi:hypothetical protein CM19_02310 [Candidatus Acidianus copahuensis]|uniref:Uncharacterized protein n=1 Tax=Candidatus Acidianus copahuensis TaxID=1160895 RepID=A0A031LVA0_9CREN|nr:hypothetical protein [Candidatus Acidianus copahuensis]EZQ11053.1 hypothetical protein CM19_02310 [Candidatus Acidianus copahuensis]
MTIRYFTIISLLFNIIVAVLPGYWWYYSVGNIIIVKDSLFYLNINLLGNNIEIIKVINMLLFAFRVYVIVISISLLISTIRGNKVSYLLISWASIFYILDPIIMYFAFNYLVSYFIPFHYNFFIIGKEIATFQYQYKITMLIESYPSIQYWFALFVGILNLVSKFIRNY